MRYITITTWELTSGADFALTVKQVEAVLLPALLALGAERVQLVQTSDRTVAAISEWPDKPTRDAAERAIQEVRDKVRREDFTRMTGEMGGKVVAGLSAEEARALAG